MEFNKIYVKPGDTLNISHNNKEVLKLEINNEEIIENVVINDGVIEISSKVFYPVK